MTNTPQYYGSNEAEIVEKIMVEAKTLRRQKHYSEANQTIRAALKQYPDNERLHRENVEIATCLRKPAVLIKRLDALLKVQGRHDVRIRTVIRIARFYLELRQPLEADHRVADGLKVHPRSIELLKLRAEIALLRQDWMGAAERWRAIYQESGVLPSPAERITAVCGHWVSLFLHGGVRDISSALKADFHSHQKDWLDHYKHGYANFVLFNNGRTRVEFRPKIFDPATLELCAAKTLVVTFDVMTGDWHQDPYGFVALKQRNFDMLSVRKRDRTDFHQEFSRFEFLDVARPVANHYQRVVAMGQSLGGYSALYYAVYLKNCSVLATAPRNPLHPKYASAKYSDIAKFRHEYDMPPTDARPTIVFDPKDHDDARYIRKSLARTFPNAVYVEYPYCGHSLMRYLREVGVLKVAVLGFCEGHPFPPFDRSLRSKSAEYLRNVAKLNHRAKRLNWALQLARKALEIGTDIEKTELLIRRIGPPPVDSK